MHSVKGVRQSVKGSMLKVKTGITRMVAGRRCLGIELMMERVLRRREKRGTRYQNVKLRRKNKN
jgi:hypothetical protein